MRSEFPLVFAPSAKVSAPGIQLLDAGEPWQLVRGLLAVDAAEFEKARQQWLRSICVRVVFRADQYAVLGRPFGEAEPFSQVARLQGKLALLELRFDLRDVPGLELLQDEACFVHLTCGPFASEVQERKMSAPSELLLAKDDAGQLAQAYELARRGQWKRALPLLEHALESKELRANLDRPHLFNAACIASQLANATQDLDARVELVKKARAFLEEDYALGRAQLERIWERLSKAPPEPERRKLQLQRDLLVRHLDARSSDPDLAALRAAS